MDEIKNYEPLPLCSCEKCVCHVNERISNLHHREAIMQLLMGLNDSFSHIRGQKKRLEFKRPCKKVR